MIGNPRRVSFSSSVFDEEPADLALFLLHISVASQSENGQLRKDLLVNRTLRNEASWPACFGDKCRTSHLDPLEPVHGSLLLLQDRDRLGPDGIRVKRTPGPDCRMVVHPISSN